MNPKLPHVVFVETPPRTSPAITSKPGRPLFDATARPEWEVRKAEHYCVPEPIIGPPHFHPHVFQVFKVIQGKGVLHIGDESFDANAGGLFWIPPNVCHWSQDPPNQSPRIVEVQFRRTTRAASPFHPERFPGHIASDRFPDVMECFQKIVREFTRRQPLWEWNISATLNELLALVARVIEMGAHPAPAGRVEGYRVETEGISKALDYIHQNYFETIDLPLLARTAGMSVSRFAKLFRAMEGTTPIDYLIAFRLQKASEMREERDLTLTQVATAVGFSSLQHFSSCYKQRMGVSPSRHQTPKP